MAVELPSDKISIKGAEATPPAYTSEQSTGNNLLTTLVSLVCGALCKDTPLAEIIPAPTEVPQATASYNNGMCRVLCWENETKKYCFVLCVLYCSVAWFLYSFYCMINQIVHVVFLS